MTSKSTSKTKGFSNTLSFLKNNKWSYKYIIFPYILNLLIFIIFWISLFNFLSALILGLGFLQSIPALLTAFVSGTLLILTFLICAYLLFLFSSLIASPFNGILVQKMLENEKLIKKSETTGVNTIINEIKRSATFEVVKLFLIGALFVLGLLLPVIPLVGVLLSLVINYVGNTYLALVDFYDPALSNSGFAVRERFKFVRSNILKNKKLFLATLTITFIPLINILFIPFAVISATLTFIRISKSNIISP
jgi:CysZ protein